MDLSQYLTPVNIAAGLAVVVVLFGPQIFEFLKGLVPSVTDLVKTDVSGSVIEDAISVRRVLEESGNQSAIECFDKDIMPVIISELSKRD